MNVKGSALIYKYRPLNNFTESLIDKAELYFASPKDFNDPFDSNLKLLDFVDKEDILTSLKKSIDSNDHSIYKIIDEALNSKKTKEILYSHFKKTFYDFADKTAICCFSRTPIDLLLWAHYSDCHKGICLVFDSKILNETLGDLYDVNYTSKVPDINIFDDVNISVNQFFCTKSEHWSYEKESRLMKTGAGSVKFPKEALKGVIFGLKCKAENELRLLSKMMDSNYDHVQYYKTAIEKDFYKLSINKINLVKNVGF